MVDILSKKGTSSPFGLRECWTNGSFVDSNVSPYFLKRAKVVDIKDLQVVYNAGKLNQAVALNGLNFDIRAEEYVIIFGPSGCGKSTVLNIIAGLEIPSAGSVFVANEDLTTFSTDQLAYFHRNKVGMIFQQYNLIPTLNVLDNVTLPLVFERINVRERKKIGREMLERLGLENFEKRFPQELSGGQQQRVGIARALINDPPVILADEAVGNLDSESAKNALEILNNLNLENKKTIISVTHNPEHLYYADRVIYMKDGKILKIDINKEKQRDNSLKITKERTELDLLLQTFPDLSSMQLHVMLAPFKAKMLVAYFISNFESQEIKHMEEIVKGRLLGTINQWQFFEQLTGSLEQGGLNMTFPLAKKFVHIVDEVIQKSKIVSAQQKEMKKSDEDDDSQLILESIEKMRHSLLDDFGGELSLDQISALNKGIEYRLLSKISRDEFMEYMDRPFHLGGVGLNRKTAKKLSRKMELVMLVEYGR